MKPIIQVKDIRKVYRMGEERIVALNRINLDIYPGEICCIFGTSGSGKSTFLNQLAGMEKPTRGTVNILGKNISAMNEQQLAAFRQKNVGFIFQAYNLLPGLTAKENVALPLTFQGIPEKKRLRIAEILLKKVGLENRMDHFPGQMSGGQQQRVGIARAFVTRPAIIFADEPTGNLDSRTTTEVMEMITDFAQKYHQTIVMVTHDEEMSQYADRIVKLVDGDVVLNQLQNVNRSKIYHLNQGKTPGRDRQGIAYEEY